MGVICINENALIFKIRLKYPIVRPLSLSLQFESFKTDNQVLIRYWLTATEHFNGRSFSH